MLFTCISKAPCRCLHIHSTGHAGKLEDIGSFAICLIYCKCIYFRMYKFSWICLKVHFRMYLNSRFPEDDSSMNTLDKFSLCTYFPAKSAKICSARKYIRLHYWHIPYHPCLYFVSLGCTMLSMILCIHYWSGAV